jgi:hypothetical protein
MDDLESPGKPRPRLVVVSHPSAAVDRHLLSLSDPDGGLLVVAVSPIVESIGRLAGDILGALGKHNQNAPFGRVASLETAWAHDWLRGHQVRRVAFIHADHLPAAIVSACATLVADAGAEPWLVFDRPGIAVALGSVAGSAATIEDAETLARRLTALPGPVPASSVAELLAVDRVGVPPADELADAVRIARHCLESAAPGAPSLITLVTARLAPGWKLVATETPPARSAASLPDQPTEFDWRRFRRFRDTTQAAAAVLATMQLAVTEMLALRVSNVSEDASLVGVVGGRLAVPPAARYLLRACRAAALRAAPDNADGRLLAHRGRRLTPYHLRTMVSVAFDEFARSVVRLDIPYRVNPDERWLRLRGFRVVRDEDYRKPYPLFTRPGRTEPSYTYRTAHRVWRPRRLGRRGSA